MMPRNNQKPNEPRVRARHNTLRDARRQLIIDAARRVFERVGFDGASIRLMAAEAGCTTGAIYPWFAGKEEVYAAILADSLGHLSAYSSRVVIRKTLRNDALPPLKRLQAFVDASITAIRNHNVEYGYSAGDFAAEVSDHIDLICKRVTAICTELREALAYCLKAAVKAGELSKSLRVGEVADFIVMGLRGAVLVSK